MMLLIVDSHFCSILFCSLWTMFRYGSLPVNLSGYCMGSRTLAMEIRVKVSILQTLHTLILVKHLHITN